MVERRRARDDPPDAGRRHRSRRRPLRISQGPRVVTGNLFDFPDSESPSFRSRLAESLAGLARDRIYIGGSSWKYEGWLDQIYTRSNYLSRGRFSKKAFEAECLREYTQVFPTVCGDFAFYQFPAESFWQRLFSQAPAGFQFAFKIPEQITCKVFPVHARYRAQGGMENPSPPWPAIPAGANDVPPPSRAPSSHPRKPRLAAQVDRPSARSPPCRAHISQQSAQNQQPNENHGDRGSTLLKLRKIPVEKHS